jgi:exonuclease VII small subunit
MTDQPSTPNRWANLRDICSAIRELVIVAAMLVLLIAPSFVRDSLERAGIRSVAGVEFDMENLAQSREELDSALAMVESLKSKLDVAQQQVQGLAESSPAISPSASLMEPTGGGGPMLRSSPSPSLASVSRLLSSMQNQADETDQSLRRSKDHADQFLENAGRRIQLIPPDVLFGKKPDDTDSSAELPSDESITR